MREIWLMAGCLKILKNYCVFKCNNATVIFKRYIVQRYKLYMKWCASQTCFKLIQWRWGGFFIFTVVLLIYNFSGHEKLHRILQRCSEVWRTWLRKYKYKSKWFGRNILLTQKKRLSIFATNLSLPSSLKNST